MQGFERSKCTKMEVNQREIPHRHLFPDGFTICTFRCRHSIQCSSKLTINRVGQRLTRLLTELGDYLSFISIQSLHGACSQIQRHGESVFQFQFQFLPRMDRRRRPRSKHISQVSQDRELTFCSISLTDKEGTD